MAPAGLPGARTGLRRRFEWEIARPLTYPTSEQALNAANYKAAVAAQGEDRLTTRLWFDVF
ncbi:MAG TPA: hypothetical protein VN038_19495 [Dyadobacter sp.]|nr:hypothetical protein [Dyadobacter sp.]